MQPQQPSTGPVPQQPTPLTPGVRVPSQVPGTSASALLPDSTDEGRAQTGKPRNRRLRLWLAMAAGILVLLGLGGAGVLISVYVKKTAIVRTDPGAVVDSFLRAYLVNHDPSEASLYECKSGGDFDEIAKFQADIASRETKFSVGIRVTWTSFTVATNGKGGSVITDLVRTVTDQSGRDRAPWRFTMVDQGGWRVCGATALD